MARRSHTGGWTGELDAAKRVLIDDTKKCVASELETIAIANEAYAVWNTSEVGAPPSLIALAGLQSQWLGAGVLCRHTALATTAEG